jgi:hypothetical protein
MFKSIKPISKKRATRETLVTTNNNSFISLKNEVTNMTTDLKEIKNTTNKLVKSINNYGDSLSNLDKRINKCLIGTMDIVFFMPEVEIPFIYPVISNVIRNNVNYHVNIVNEGDIGTTRENIVAKFIKYYNNGNRLFMTWSYSSILGELNEFFNNVHITHPNINLNDIVLLDTYSTAVDLQKSNGDISVRNRHCKRMYTTDALTLSIMNTYTLDIMKTYDECVMLYVDDTYGRQYPTSIREVCKNNNIPYSEYPNSKISDCVDYVNNTKKNILLFSVIFTEDILTLFNTLAEPSERDENSKIKLVMAETVNFLSDIIDNPVFLNKYRKYQGVFWQYVGSHPSLPFIKKHLSSDVKGSNIAYLVTDSLNILNKCQTLKDSDSKLNLNRIYDEISENHFGLSGYCKLNEKYNRNTTMYLYAMLSINTEKDDTQENNPFPYIVSEYFTEYNGYVTILDDEESKKSITSLDDKDYYFSNWFQMDFKMESKYIDEGETIGSTYGIGVITFDESLEKDKSLLKYTEYVELEEAEEEEEEEEEEQEEEQDFDLENEINISMPNVSFKVNMRPYNISKSIY